MGTKMLVLFWIEYIGGGGTFFTHAVIFLQVQALALESIQYKI